jgi:hypothetical protein
MNLDLTDEETAALLRELDSLIDGDRYFMSQRIKTLKAIRAKIRPEPVREPLPPPPKQYAPPRVTARQRRRDGRCCRIAARTRGGGTLHDGEISLAHCGDLLLGQFAQICGNM